MVWTDTVFPSHVHFNIFLFGERVGRKAGCTDVTAKQIILFGKLLS